MTSVFFEVKDRINIINIHFIHMSIRFRYLMAVFVVLLAISSFAGITAAAEEDEKLIHVSGTGKVTTSPDVAEISLAVQTEDQDGLFAQQENARRMSECISALKTLGLTDEDIKTTGYSMYSYKTDSDAPFGGEKTVYRVTNTLLVKTTKTDMAGEIIDKAIANGANSVNYVSFTLSDEKSQSLRSEALTKAVTQARLDADSVSAALGVSILGVQSVNVGSSYTPYTYAESNYKSMSMDSAAGTYPTPIQADTVDVTASVSISYIIR